jgi:hypothetical protein
MRIEGNDRACKVVPTPEKLPADSLAPRQTSNFAHSRPVEIMPAHPAVVITRIHIAYFLLRQQKGLMAIWLQPLCAFSATDAKKCGNHRADTTRTATAQVIVYVGNRFGHNSVARPHLAK